MRETRRSLRSVNKVSNMPNCFIKKCKSTNYMFNKNVKYFSFPKDQELRLKSKLETCCKNDDNFKVTHGNNYSINFKNYIEIKLFLT